MESVMMPECVTPDTKCASAPSSSVLRLRATEARNNFAQTVNGVADGENHVILSQDGLEVAAIIHIEEFWLLENLIEQFEFDKLCDIMEELKPSQYSPEEEEYYQDDIAIHCMYPDLIVATFNDIIEAVRYENEVFGILPIENMGDKEVDIFMPVAIIMSCDRLWVPEYLFVK